MAFHAIKTGEGDTYIAAGVEAVSRAGAGAPFEFNHARRRLGGRRVRRLHPDGHDRRERRRALQRQPRGAGRVGGDLAATAPSRPSPAVTSTGRSSRSPCRRTKTSTRRATRSTCRRRSSARTTARARARRWRSSPRCKPVFKEGGTVTAGNACPLNDGAAALLIMSDERAKELGHQAACADRRLDRRRAAPGDHGPRPDPGDPETARSRRA